MNCLICKKKMSIERKSNKHFECEVLDRKFDFSSFAVKHRMRIIYVWVKQLHKKDSQNLFLDLEKSICCKCKQPTEKAKVMSGVKYKCLKCQKDENNQRAKNRYWRIKQNKVVMI